MATRRGRVERTAEPKGKRGAKKDPNAPKKNLSAYNFYFQSKRKEIKDENPDATFGEISKLVSQQFKNLDPSEKEEWENMAKDDKARYQREMKSYGPAPPKGGKAGKGGKPGKDPNAPKKNLSSYMLYASAMRPQMKEENPAATFGELGKIMGERFRALSVKDRKKWDEKAAADKQRYQRELAEYERTKEEEEEEEEEESEEEVEAVAEEVSSEAVSDDDEGSDDYDSE